MTLHKNKNGFANTTKQETKLEQPAISADMFAFDAACMELELSSHVTGRFIKTIQIDIGIVYHMC
eukprot:5456139-Amphidinium_carterae.1